MSSDDIGLVIGNAAGTCKTIQDVARFAAFPLISYVTVGSITVNERSGNPEPRTHNGDRVFFNSLGMPNGGTPYYETALGEMRVVADRHDKGLRVSIAGFNPKEYRHLAHMTAPHADTIEINLGCPNIRDHGMQHRIVSFEPRVMRSILEQVTNAAADYGPNRGRASSIAVKLSPYSDPSMITRVAEVLADFPPISLVLSNTFPNALPLNADGTRAISGKGYAGMSGPACRGFVLGQVAQFRELLPKARITAVGGITSGRDVRDYLAVGANDVQVGTACYLGGEAEVQRIAQEYLLECA